MDYPSSMEVAHGLCCLSGNIDTLLHWEGLSPRVDVLVECVTFTETVGVV